MTTTTATEPRVLPATQLRVPASITTGRTVIRKTAQESETVSMEVLIDGKPVGSAEDQGHGGGIHLSWHESADRLAAFNAVVEQYVAMRDDATFLGAEALLNDLVEEYVTARDLNRTLTPKSRKVACLKGLDSLRVIDTYGDFVTSHPEWLTVSGMTVTEVVAGGDARDYLVKAGVTHVWTAQGWTALS